MGLLSSRNTPFTPSELTPGHPPPPGRCPTFFGHLEYHNDFEADSNQVSYGIVVIAPQLLSDPFSSPR